MKRGCLVVFTGIDGSGKTTQAYMLVKALQETGFEVSYVWNRWEPLILRPVINQWKNKIAGNSESSHREYNEINSRKKRLLSNPVIRWLWLISFFIDYGLQVFIKIRIKLLSNKLIISDRIFYDSIIDQAINLEERGEWLLHSLDSFWMKILFPEPETVLYIDCPADIAFLRKEDAPNIEYLSERRKLYLKLLGRYKWIKIDGTLPVDEIAVQIRDEVYKRLELQNIKDHEKQNIFR